MNFRTFKLHKKLKPLLVLSALLLFTNVVFAAQELGQFGAGAGTPEAKPAGSSSLMTSEMTYYILGAAVVVELLAVLILAAAILKLIKAFYGISLKQLATGTAETGETVVAKKKSWFSFERLNNTVPIEKEKDLIMDHDYDGIHELDNKMPPWFLWLFRVTIGFAVIYLLVYHVFHVSPLQLDEYKNQIAVADKEMEEYRKHAANQVDENNVVQLTEANQISSGKTIFETNCVACHGAHGEGGVGPNLTDDYWLHGGGIKHIFKTIKYGVVEKGMKSWETDLSPAQIQEVASFIMSLHGTNPANAKEKQGELYKEEESVAKTDSTQTAKTDSVKVGKM